MEKTDLTTGMIRFTKASQPKYIFSSFPLGACILPYYHYSKECVALLKSLCKQSMYTYQKYKLAIENSSAKEFVKIIPKDDIDEVIDFISDNSILPYCYDFGDCSINVDTDEGINTLKKLVLLGKRVSISKICIRGEYVMSINKAVRIITKSGIYPNLELFMKSVKVEGENTGYLSHLDDKDILYFSYVDYSKVKDCNLDPYKVIGFLDFVRLDPKWEFNTIGNRVKIIGSNFFLLTKYGGKAFKNNLKHLQIVINNESAFYSAYKSDEKEGVKNLQKVVKKAPVAFPHLKTIGFEYRNYDNDIKLGEFFKYSNRVRHITIKNKLSTPKKATVVIKFYYGIFMIANKNLKKFYSTYNARIELMHFQIFKIDEFYYFRSMFSMDLPKQRRYSYSSLYSTFDASEIEETHFVIHSSFIDCIEISEGKSLKPVVLPNKKVLLNLYTKMDISKLNHLLYHLDKKVEVEVKSVTEIYELYEIQEIFDAIILSECNFTKIEFDQGFYNLLTREYLKNDRSDVEKLALLFQNGTHLKEGVLMFNENLTDFVQTILKNPSIQTLHFVHVEYNPSDKEIQKSRELINQHVVPLLDEYPDRNLTVYSYGKMIRGSNSRGRGMLKFVHNL